MALNSFQRVLANADQETKRKQQEAETRGARRVDQWATASRNTMTRAQQPAARPPASTPPPPIPSITPLPAPVPVETDQPDPAGNTRPLSFEEYTARRGGDPAINKPKGNAAYQADRQQGTTGKRGSSKTKATAAKKPARKAAKPSGRRQQAQPRPRAADPDELDADPADLAEIRQYAADFSAPKPLTTSAADLAEHDPVYVMLPSRAIPVGGLRWELALDDRLMPQIDSAIQQLVECVAFDHPNTSAAEQWAIRMLIFRLGKRLTKGAPIMVYGEANQ